MRTRVAICAILVLASIVENTVFGQDQPGAKHDISIVFFLLGLLGLIGLLGLLAISLTRRLRRPAAR